MLLYDLVMQLLTFDQFFSYRSLCLCGKPLIISYPKGVFIDDNYTRITACYIENLSNKDVIRYYINIDSKSIPYGDVSFIISCNAISNKIKISDARYNDPYRKPRLSVDEFIKKHFNQEAQLNLKLNLAKKCPNEGMICSINGYLCDHNYCQRTKPLTFNLSSKNMNLIQLDLESFDITNHSKIIHVETNYNKKISKIIIRKPSNGLEIGKEQIIEMSSEKFLNFPLEHEFLFNKINTLLLFS